MARSCVSLTVLLCGLMVGGAVAGESTAASGDVRWLDLPHTDTVFTPAKYDSLEQWQVRRGWLRDQVRFAAGLIPEPQRTPLNAQIFGKTEHEGYTIEKVYFESYPGFYVTGNLYRPTDVQGRIPAVACPHGHWAKGRIHHDDSGSIPARCITLAKLGAVVFAYDMIGYNDNNRQLEHRDERLNTPETALWTIGPMHLQTWNSIRVLDFLQSLPDVDPARIGVTGASGGGTQTFILSAVDDRVKVACPVNMISSIMQGGCVCENAPLLRIDTNNMEIAALFAPKPLMMISATGDWTKNTPTVEYPFVRGIYELYGQADRIANAHIDAPHNYNLDSRNAMYPFFAKWLLGRDDADNAKEGKINLEKPEDLLAFNDDNRPANMLKLDELIEQLKATARKRMESFKPTSREKLDELTKLVRQGLDYAVGSAFPSIEEITCTENKNQSIKRRDDERPSLLCMETVYERKGRPVKSLHFEISLSSQISNDVRICVLPKGLLENDRMTDEVDDLLSAHWKTGGGYLIFVEPFSSGTATQPADLDKPRGSTKFFTTFNRTDAAEAVFDILTVLGRELRVGRKIRDREPRVSLIGFGRMGPICLTAAAMVPNKIAKDANFKTIIDLNRFDPDSDKDYVEQLFLPGIQRIGGLKALTAAAVAGGLRSLHNTGDAFDATWANQAAKITGARLHTQSTPADLNAIPDWLSAQKQTRQGSPDGF